MMPRSSNTTSMRLPSPGRQHLLQELYLPLPGFAGRRLSLSMKMVMKGAENFQRPGI